MDNFNHHFFKLQSQLLVLNLQLAEAEEKPKRAGDFETTYKNAAGNEITIKRSPDGKFANKNGGATTTATKPDNTPPLDPQVARENGRAVREILTGKVGDDIKKDLAADFEHRPIIKEAIEKVDFAEVTKGDADALTNINNFMQRKFKEAVDASSMLGRELAAAAVAVAGYTARWLAFGLALRGTLLVPASVGLIKQGETPKEILKRVAELSPELIKEVFSLKHIGRTARRGAIIEGIFRAIDLAVDAVNKPTPPLVEPEADRAVREAMRGIGGNALKNSLIAGATQTPGVAEGVKDTNIEDVIKGDNDSFSNAVDFLQNKITEAATAVSENKKEIAIGTGVVALTVAATTLGTIAGTLTGSVIANTLVGLVTGKGLTEAIKLGLTRLTPAGAKALLSNPVVARLSEYKIVKSAIAAINEQVESVKLARNGGIGAKSFGSKEESVKKLVAEEGLDYEKVLQAIARHKEEPPNPKKAAQIQKDILKLEREIQEGAIKIGALTRGKLALNPIEMTQVLGIVKKENELRNRIIEKRASLDTAEGRGFSLAKRLNELVEIEEKQGKESPSYKWRSNVIKAEVQYGEKLDRLDDLGGYGKLNEAMKKTQPAPGTYESTNYADDKALSQIFQLSNSPVLSSADNQRIVFNAAQKEGLELQNYLSTPINAQVGIKGGLTCAFPGGNNKYSYMTKAMAEGEKVNLYNVAPKLLVETDFFKDKNIDGYINIGDVAIQNVGLRTQGYNALASTKEHTREMMWHESGHLLEVKLSKVEESVAFREDRAQEVPSDRKVIPQQGLSAGAQGYTLGEFYSPYIGLNMMGQGRYVDTNRATEVLSSGMELLSSPTLAKRGVKADRETMLYALAAMNEKMKD